MVDFRKWLFAFAVVAVLLVSSAPAHAQQFISNTFTCLANAGVPPIVRAEGITELVGDVVLTCTGGTPTAVGLPIPLSNLTVFLNTNITSRLVGGSFSNGSEALVLIDEPFPSNPNPANAAPPSGFTPAPQGYCPVSSTGQLGGSGTFTAGSVTSVGCGIAGTGGGIGAAGPYRTTNIFQGEQVGANSVAWLGLPIDAPGTTNQRTIRITNVRGNACQLGTSSTLIPTQIVMFISVNGSQQVTINNPQQTVGFIQPGLVVGNTTNTFLQCQNLFGNLVTSGAAAGQSGIVSVTATEGFASSFKARGYATPLGSAGAGSNASVIGTPSATLQNVPGFPYNTESGFVSTATGGAATGATGVADFGTRIMINVGAVGAGVSIFAPAVIPLIVSGSFTSNAAATGFITLTGGSGIPSGGLAVLVTGTDANGNGGSLVTYSPTATSQGANTAVTLAGTAGFVVYEIVQSNPNAIEQLRIPTTAAFISNTGSNLPGLGQSTATVSFAPLSTVNTASSSAPIPRFCPGAVARNLFAINQCSCNLLFPFVTNQAGFDTGVAIANTSLDPFGTPPQSGTVTLNYYGGTTGGGAAPAAQTSQTVAAGSELIFTLSNGGGLGIAATPGFQGYIIATARFQYCHAFAFVSDLGAQRLAEGYLAIQLDVPVVTVSTTLPTGLNRTGQAGENEGH